MDARMIWWGENRSKRMLPWKVGDLVRYDFGPTALMRISAVITRGGDIGTCYHYYGRAFHSSGPCTSRYHGQCMEPDEEDRLRWIAAHDDDDKWIRGKWGD